MPNLTSVLKQKSIYMGQPCIHITRSYSRDHRPDLNQVVLSLITENQAGIPLYMQAVSGNVNDSETFKKTVKILCCVR